MISYTISLFFLIFILLCLPLLVGEDVATAVVDSAAVFLYSLFSSDQRWTREHAEKIRKTLGPFPASAANRACETVKKILALSPEKIDNTSKNPPSENSESIKEFGHNIVFSTPANLLEVTTYSGKRVGNGGMTEASDSLSEDEEVTESDAFSRAFLVGMATKTKTDSSNDRVKSKLKTKSSGSDAAVMATGDHIPKLYSSDWLVRRLQECCHGDQGSMSWNDLYTAVFEVLSSAQDSSLIESDVSTHKQTPSMSIEQCCGLNSRCVISLFCFLFCGFFVPGILI